MSAWLVLLVTVAYVGTAVALYAEGRSGLGITFMGYALANVGIVIDIITKGH